MQKVQGIHPPFNDDLSGPVFKHSLGSPSYAQI